MTSTTVARFPFVSKVDIVRAYRPGAAVSDRTFRTLRARGVTSPGIDVRHRSGGRLKGQVRCYAALNIDAAVLARHDRHDEAAEVAEQEGHFEQEWQPLVASIVKEFALADFDAFRSARNLIVHALAPATQQLEALHAQLSAGWDGFLNEEFVRITELTQHWATLQIVGLGMSAAAKDLARSITSAFEPAAAIGRQLAVDAFLPRAADLGIGDLALLRIEHSAGASLLSLLAAIQDDQQEDEFTLDDEFAPFFDEDPLPADVLASLAEDRDRGNIVRVAGSTIPLAS